MIVFFIIPYILIFINLYKSFVSFFNKLLFDYFEFIEEFCHFYYLVAINLLGTLIAIHGHNTLTLLNIMRLYRLPK